MLRVVGCYTAAVRIRASGHFWGSLSAAASAATTTTTTTTTITNHSGNSNIFSKR